MAFASTTLVNALRETARRLQNGAPYAWGHHGQCNCGNLVQVVTPFSADDIQRFAQTGTGEWTELAFAHCSSTGAPVDLLVQQLVEIGLTPTDIHHLEYLSDKAVLKNLPGGFRWLHRNRREDAIVYFEAFADLLEDKLLNEAVAKAMAEVGLEEASSFETRKMAAPHS